MVAAPPVTLAGYFLMVLRGLPARIGFGLVMKFLVAVPIAGAALLLHTFLLVVMNEGFGESSPIWSPMLALGGTRLLTGTALWGLAAWLVTALITRALTMGPVRLASDLAGAPGWIAESARRAEGSSVAVLAGAFAVGELGGSLFASRPLALTLFFGGLFALSMRQRGTLLTVSRLAWWDAERLMFQGHPRHPFRPERVVLLQVGLAFGLLRAALLPYQPGIGLCGGLALGLVALVLLLLAVRSGVAAAALLAVVVVEASLRVAVADDGGWQEGGGTFVSWVTSDGAVVAVLHGVPPALGTLLGVIFGSTPDLFPPIDFPEGADMPEDVGGWTEPGSGDWDDVPPPGVLDGGTGPWDDPFGPHQGGGPGLCGPGAPAWFVDVASRSLAVRDVLFAIDAPGMPLRFALIWPGAAGPKGLVGRGWRCSWDLALGERQGQTVVWLPTGRVVPLAGDVSADGLLRLERGAAWKVHDADARLVWVFDDHRPRRVARVEDAFGNALVLHRDDKGRLERVVDAVGRSIALHTDDVGRIVGLTLEDGRTATLAYDAAGLLREVIDLVGLPTRYTYASDAIVEIRVGDDPPHVVKIEVESGARPAVAALTDPAGGRTRYEARGGAVVVTGPDGHPWRHEVTNGRVTAVVDPEGRRTSSTFDAQGRRTAMTSADGATWTWAWDAAGRPLRATDPVGLSRAWTWDAGDLVEEVGPDGARWRYRYDRHAIVGVEAPDGATTTLTLDGRGAPASLVDALGRTSRWERDRFGNVTSVVGPEGVRLRIEWDAHGLRPVAWTDAAGRHEAVLDGNDRVTAYTAPGGLVTRLTWSCCGPVGNVDPLGRENRYERDGAGRLLKWVGPAGEQVLLRYDPAGNLDGMGDGTGSFARFERDRSGRVTAVLAQDGSPVARLERDARGLAIAAIDPSGAVTRIERDPAGRPVRAIDPLGRATTWTLDARDRRAVSVDGRNQPVKRTWDARGRLVEVTAPDTVPTKLRWDAGGRLVGWSDPAGDVRLEWDDGDRLVATKWKDGHALRLTHDAAGRVIARSLPGGFDVVETPDPVTGRPARVAFGPHSVEVRWDAAGRPTEIRRSNGTATRVRWNVRDVVDEIAHARQGRPFFSQRITYDVIGRPVACSGEAPVLSAPPEPDALEADAAGQIRRTQGASCAYDVAGNRLAGPGWKARYDARDRLVEVHRGAHVQRLEHDGLGRVVVDERDGEKTRILRDLSGRRVAEVGPDRRVHAVWIHVGEMPVARLDDRGGVLFLHHDAWARTVAATDARGEVVGAWAYDPWGRRTQHPDLDLELPFGWLGGVGAEQLGGDLVQLGARAYDTRSGTFLQRDPLGLHTGQHPYQYVYGSPICGIDPRGTDAITTITILWGIFLFGSFVHLNNKFDASKDTNSPFHKVNAVLNAASNPTPENKAAAEAAMKNADPQTMAWWAFSIPAAVGERVANVTPFDLTVSGVKGGYSISQGEGLKGLLEIAGGIPIVPFLPPKAGDIGEVMEHGLDTANEVIYGGDAGTASCTAPVGPGK